MDDGKLDKIITGLNACARTDGKYCGACPYTDEGECVAVMSRDVLELLKEYKRHDECPCTHCMEWECDEVCEEYKKWKDS